MSQARQRQLANGLAAVESRISKACVAAGRRREEITLVVVTKTYPAADVADLVDLGVRDVGESRDQEASAKVAELGSVASQVQWHFIGRLQTNKASRVATYADLVHSVDRESLVAALGRGARGAQREVSCLVQVSLDGDTRRGGVDVAQLTSLATRLRDEPGLRLRGIMAVAPQHLSPDQAFLALPELSGMVRDVNPDARIISAGMSGDLEAAVGAGATHLRVGSAVLGSRQSLQ